MKRIVLLCLSLAACADATAPVSDPAAIVFRIHASCPALSYQLFIDGQHVAAREMVANDSAVFPVDPGSHAAGAVALDGAVSRTWFSKPSDLKSGERLIVSLRCD